MLNKKRKLLKNQKGFTLIELLAVIVILAIIAAIAIPAIANVIKNSRFNAIKSDAIQVISAAKLYAADNDVKPGQTIEQKDLAKYVDDKDSKLTKYEVKVITGTDEKVDYQLTGEGSDGGVKVTFTNASLADINSAKRTSDNVTIGTATP
ncbi:prepilin-type N-terminal cleavage/methylation domain-containing protein [Heyndrickxia coagulans]|uniref:prepilin-type N-terminal cleavage/methylation domain-containing protein n=1 Tax=Heyndrickxia coagulans TaxID=1398 RepID=UPI00266D78CB|nr:prepilin-type N-terminal cleavage/methylation domain-containing protein [Heyndrickxia coagulans]